MNLTNVDTLIWLKGVKVLKWKVKSEKWKRGSQIFNFQFKKTSGSKVPMPQGLKKNGSYAIFDWFFNSIEDAES